MYRWKHSSRVKYPRKGTFSHSCFCWKQQPTWAYTGSSGPPGNIRAPTGSQTSGPSQSCTHYFFLVGFIHFISFVPEVPVSESRAQHIDWGSRESHPPATQILGKLHGRNGALWPGMSAAAKPPRVLPTLHTSRLWCQLPMHKARGVLFTTMSKSSVREHQVLP